MFRKKNARRKLIIDSEKPPRDGHPILWSLIIVGVASILVAGYWLFPRVMAYTEKVPALPPSGGWKVDPPVVLKVPHFSQADSRWGMQFLGATPATIAQEGCAMTCGAMILKHYGVDLDPGRLNRWLTATAGGYSDRGWIFWEYAAMTSNGAVEHVYEENASSYWLIDRNLLIEENPVIARVKMKNGITHFVVIVGKDGYDYLVLDPAAPPGSRPYPLKKFQGDGTPILGIRYFEKVTDVAPGGLPDPIRPPAPSVPDDEPVDEDDEEA